MISPKLTQPAASSAEGVGDRSFVAWSLGPDMFGAIPLAIASGAQAESPPIYVQGFNTFQVFVSATGVGSIAVAYGICHPSSFTVVAYRTVVTATPVSTSMLATFGAFGQSVAAFQGDLFTAFTIRLSATVAAITVNSCVLWCGVR
jgi:hypothetical protein